MGKAYTITTNVLVQGRAMSVFLHVGEANQYASPSTHVTKGKDTWIWPQSLSCAHDMLVNSKSEGLSLRR